MSERSVPHAQLICLRRPMRQWQGRYTCILAQLLIHGYYNVRVVITPRIKVGAVPKGRRWDTFSVSKLSELSISFFAGVCFLRALRPFTALSQWASSCFGL